LVGWERGAEIREGFGERGEETHDCDLKGKKEDARTRDEDVRNVACGQDVFLARKWQYKVVDGTIVVCRDSPKNNAQMSS
jgi:hypothetical protein